MRDVQVAHDLVDEPIDEPARRNSAGDAWRAVSQCDLVSALFSPPDSDARAVASKDPLARPLARNVLLL